MSGSSNDWVGRTLSGGRYRVDAKLGEGGMGFVYKVWDRNLDTDVVIKVPRRLMLDDPEFAERFSLEIRSLVKLSHPHIVKVSDVGEHEGLPFAVMQYLSGGTLDERQDYGRDGRAAPASPGSLAGWLPGMAAALDFIHRKNYIHRDVKPANILFDTDGHSYLSDFGVAKVISDVEASARRGAALTGVGIVLGTPEYMAPELIMGGAFDGRVDQYALAVTAYEILCGRKPFTGDTPTAVLVRQTTLDPPPMVELPSAGLEAITRVILKGLAKKPEGRFANCVDFASALVAALARVGVRGSVDRLTCPSCGTGFAPPANLDGFKGKKSKCQVCKAPFRFANDGMSLIPIEPDSAPTPSGAVDLSTSGLSSASPRANPTVKLGAMPAPPQTAPVPRADRTVKLEAMPAPAPPDGLAPIRAARTQKLEAIPDAPRSDPPATPRANRTQKLEAMPARPGPEDSDAVEADDSPSLRDGSPARRSPLPWVIGAAGFALVAILGVALAMSPKRGTVQFQLESPAEGATVSIDGDLLDPDRLKGPITLAVGPHRLEAKSTGYAPLQADLIVSAGTNAPFPVRLTLLPVPKPVEIAGAPPIAPEAASTPQLAMAEPSLPGFSTTNPPLEPERPAPSPPMAPEISPIGPVEKPGAATPPDPEKPDDEPAPKNPLEKADATLKQIVGNPADYLDRVVSPSELLIAGTESDGPGRSRSLSVKIYRDGPYQKYQKDGASLEIVLGPEVAATLGEQVRNGNLVRGEYPAILKMKVVKNPNNGNEFRGIVEWIEYLVYVDPVPIAKGKNLYNKAFTVVNITPGGCQIGLSPSHKEWRAKLHPTNIVSNLKNAYNAAFVIDRGSRFVQLAQAIKANLPKNSRVFHRQLMDMIR